MRWSDWSGLAVHETELKMHLQSFIGRGQNVLRSCTQLSRSAGLREFLLEPKEKGRSRAKDQSGFSACRVLPADFSWLRIAYPFAVFRRKSLTHLARRGQKGSRGVRPEATSARQRPPPPMRDNKASRPVARRTPPLSEMHGCQTD